MIRRTLGRAVRRAGVGLHGGAEVALALEPAPFGHGLVFETDRGAVPATLAHARAEPGATVLTAGGATVRTPEHLLAALAALGVTDARLVLRGDELPALDGSALGWVEAVDEAGRVDGPPLAPWRPDGPRHVAAFGGEATLAPHDGGEIGVVVAFEPDGPRGALRVPTTEAAFRAEIAWARTFVLARDVDRLRAAGRGRGATPENTVVWPADAAALRSPDEPVRHKLLDAWGDLALLGPASVALTVVRGSHALHLAVLRLSAAPGPRAPSAPA